MAISTERVANVPPELSVAIAIDPSVINLNDLEQSPTYIVDSSITRSAANYYLHVANSLQLRIHTVAQKLHLS